MTIIPKFDISSRLQTGNQDDQIVLDIIVWKNVVYAKAGISTLNYEWAGYGDKIWNFNSWTVLKSDSCATQWG